MATNSPGFMEMSATDNGGGQIGSLAVPLEGLLDGRHGALAHVGHAAGLAGCPAGPSRPAAGGTAAARARTGRRRCHRHPATATGRIGCLRCRAGRGRSRRTRVHRRGRRCRRGGAAVVVARRSCGGRGRRRGRGGRRGRRGHGGRLDHRGQQVGHAGERRRNAGRVVGRGDPAQGQEAGEVGLRCREADGLDVLTLDGGDGLVQRGGAAIVLAVRQDHEHPALGRRRELLGRGDHGVVQRGVAVGDDPVDLLAQQRPVGRRR